MHIARFSRENPKTAAELRLDVSKAKLDGCLLNAAGDVLARTQVPNDATGFARLLAVLRRVRVEPARVRIVLEATGV